MTTTTEDLTVAIEHAHTHRDATTERLKAAARARDAAQAAREAYGYQEAGRSAKVRLVILETEARLEEAEARLAECRQIREVAQTQYATLVRRAYLGRHQRRLETARVAAQALVAALVEDQADQTAIAQALGVVATEGHPLAVARQLVSAIDAELRSLTPAPARAAMLPPGYVRVKALMKFTDRDGRVHWPDAGAVDALPAEDLSVVVANRWAAAAEVGG